VVLTQFVSPDDEHNVLETCRELKKNQQNVKKKRRVIVVLYFEELSGLVCKGRNVQFS